MKEQPTYICKDCKCEVFDALGEVRERCLMCQWIEDIPGIEDREKLAKFLMEVQNES